MDLVVNLDLMDKQEHEVYLDLPVLMGKRDTSV
jgi:hypothetical protein